MGRTERLIWVPIHFFYAHRHSLSFLASCADAIEIAVIGSALAKVSLKLLVVMRDIAGSISGEACSNTDAALIVPA